MKIAKYFLIVSLLIAFTLALVHCTKVENANENQDEIALNSADVIKTLNKSGIYNLTDDEMELREPQVSSCYTGGIYCTSYFFRDTIEVPNYCGYVQVNYLMWICPDGIKFSDFEANSLGCDSLTQSWVHLDDGEVDHQLELFNYYASLIVEEMVLSSIVRQYNILCQSGNVMNSSFYRNICYRWCVEFITDPHGVVFTSTHKYYCGDKCCKRTTKYCLQDNGQVQQSDPEFSEVGNGVCGSIPNGDPCRGYQTGSCQKTCGLP